MPQPPPSRDYFTHPDQTTCKACHRLIFFALNPNSGKSGPLDARACVYAMLRSDANQVPPRAQTAKQFLARVARIILDDGTELSPADIAFFPSHFTSCPKASQFTRRADRAQPGAVVGDPEAPNHA